MRSGGGAIPHRRRARKQGRTAHRHRLLHGEQLEPRMLLALTPQMLTDINTGPSGFVVHGPIVEMNGLGYFSGSTGQGDYELWRSDGTTAGTVLVKDINSSTSS